MVRIFDFCARAVFIALAAIIIFRIWVFFSPRPIDSYIHGGLIGAEQTETLFTGFATIPVLYFFADGELQMFDPSAADQNIPEKVNGFCYHLYDLAVGFENIAETIEATLAQSNESAWKLPDPKILAANVVETRHGGSLSRYKCDALDYVPNAAARAARMARFVDVLEANQQWSPHRENAHAILLGLDEDVRAARARNEKKLARLERSEPEYVAASFSPFSRRKFADYRGGAQSGSLGALKLTFSTIALFTRDKNWFFQKNEFYVRQDNAEVTYGSEFYHDFTAARKLFGAPRVTVTLPVPRVLAVNRYTLALKTHPAKFDPTHHRKGKKENEDDEILQDPIERALTAELHRQMDRVEGHAIMISKGLIADQVRALMRAQRADVEVKFENNRARADKDLIDLLRKVETERSIEPS